MKKHSYVRPASQIFFFVLIFLMSINHYLSESGSSIPIIGTASLHAICPLGGVETLGSLFMYNTFIQKIHESSVVIFLIILGISLLVGPVVCSYVCPLGSIQEWIGKLGKKIFKSRYNHFIPLKLHKVLTYMRYVVLIITLYLTTNSLKLVFLEVDPYYALLNFWSDEVTIGGLIVLGVLLLSSLFVERAWCKYACPFGALIGLTNLVSVFKIKRKPSSCISCNLCTDACPMNIDVAQKTKILDPQCIRCGECTSDMVCPVDNTVVLSAGKMEENTNEDK